MSAQTEWDAFAIYALREEDLPAVLGVWISANLQAHDLISEKHWKGNLPVMRQVLPQVQVLIYEAEGKIVDFFGIDNGYIKGIFVDTPMRPHRIGKVLLNGWKRRLPTLTLCVYEKNKSAPVFHLREGFSKVRLQQDEVIDEMEYMMQWPGVKQ